MKRKKDFLHIINDVDDKYVEEAMPPDRSGGGKSKRSIGPMLTKWLSVAACFALAVGIAFVTMNHNHNVLPPESSDCEAVKARIRSVRAALCPSPNPNTAMNCLFRK